MNEIFIKRIRKTIVDFENKLIPTENYKETESANDLESINDNISSSNILSNNFNLQRKNTVFLYLTTTWD